MGIPVDAGVSEVGRRVKQYDRKTHSRFLMPRLDLGQGGLMKWIARGFLGLSRQVAHLGWRWRRTVGQWRLALSPPSMGWGNWSPLASRVNSPMSPCRRQNRTCLDERRLRSLFLFHYFLLSSQIRTLSAVQLEKAQNYVSERQSLIFATGERNTTPSLKLLTPHTG